MDPDPTDPELIVPLSVSLLIQLRLWIFTSDIYQIFKAVNERFQCFIIFLDLLRTWYLFDDIFFSLATKNVQVGCGSGSVIIWPSGF